MPVEGDLALLAGSPVHSCAGSVAWVTGASRGLGRSFAYALAGAGAEVVLTARSAEPLESAAAEIRSHGHRAHAIPGAIEDSAEVRRIVAEIEARCRRLDILVNNAGTTAFARSEQLADEDWQRVLDVNLGGSFRCAREAFALLERSPRASVVNVSSVHGKVAGPRATAYAASKGGIEMLTRSLAVEWADRGVRVNSVAPGYVETEMTAALREHPKWAEELRARIPLGRFATTAEVASAVAFLAGSTSRYITGATLLVDGGWTAV